MAGESVGIRRTNKIWILGSVSHHTLNTRFASLFLWMQFSHRAWSWDCTGQGWWFVQSSMPKQSLTCNLRATSSSPQRALSRMGCMHFHKENYLRYNNTANIFRKSHASKWKHTYLQYYISKQSLQCKDVYEQLKKSHSYFKKSLRKRRKDMLILYTSCWTCPCGTGLPFSPPHTGICVFLLKVTKSS